MKSEGPKATDFPLRFQQNGFIWPVIYERSPMFLDAVAFNHLPFPA